MKKQNVPATAVDLLSRVLSADREDIGMAFGLTEANGVTPMEVAKFAIACEKTFGLTLYDEKIAQWRTVGDACRHISELLEEGQAEAVERSEDDRTAWFYE